MRGDDRPRVLIVDDHPAYAYGLRALLLQLHGSSFEVEATANVAEALDLVVRDEPDIVLVDVRMPRVAGVELAAQIRGISPSSRVVMLTISEDPDDVRAAFRAGAVGYLSKELGPDHVAAAITLSLVGAVTLSRAAFDVLAGTSVTDARVLPEEKRLLELISAGMRIDAIAQELVVSRATVTRMLTRLQDRYGVANRDQLITLAARRGWV